MNNNPNILLTNDDGFSAKGIRFLYNELEKSSKVTIIAPKEQQSGIGHAFTYKKPITYNRFDLDNNFSGYFVSGTPADCVKFALGHLLHEKPDLVVSGINEGKNTGIASYYSGTIAAAREAAFWRVPAIAFSVCEKAIDYLNLYAHVSIKIIRKIFADKKMANQGSGFFYNVNFPSCHPDKSKGIKVTKQSLAFYNDIYKQVENESGEKEYWIDGTLDNLELTYDYDSRAIENGFITVTPLHFDSTAYDDLAHLSDIEGVL
jgi:5'-nucleotidase